MDLKNLLEIVKDKFTNFEDLERKESKITTLSEAIKKYIKPEQLIHVAFCGGLSAAAVQEIIRQFYNKDPNFEIITIGATQIFQYMLGANLEKPIIKKLITSFAADAIPRTNLVPIFNHHIKKGMKLEYWSLLTVNLALLAAALQVPFFPTTSLLNSSMEKENVDTFMRLENPFNKDEKNADEIGLVKAIYPDVSIYHAWASDPLGNSIFIPPYGEDVFGAYASKGPVIVTTENIVDTNFIKKNQNFVRIPGYLVSCVVKAPFGSHPSMYYGLNGGYMEDIEFLVEFQSKNRSIEGLAEFVKEWIIGTEDFQDYKNKVGIKKLMELSGRLDPNSWIEDLKQKIKDIKTIDEEPINPLEFMILNASEIISEKIIQNKYDLVLAGQGYSNLSAWLARYKIATKKYHTNLVAEVGFYGYLPRLGSPFIFNVMNVPTCNMVSNIFNILAINIGRSKSCAILGAAQIDKYGNVNSSKIGAHHLVGSGGANDIGSPNRANEVIIVCVHKKDRLLEKVPYITVPGTSVFTVITSKGVLEKDENNNELILKEYFNPENKSQDEIIEDIKSETGWDLKISSNLKERVKLSNEELKILRLFDPYKFFIGK